MPIIAFLFWSFEQIECWEIDRRTDIFSAGIILYQFLTGERAFTGASTWEIAKKILQYNPPAPSTLNKTISPLFDAVIKKALAKDRNVRYQTARDFGVALRNALEGRGQYDNAHRTVISEQVELEFWKAIKDSEDSDDFELHIEKFPKGVYTALAKSKLAKLRGGKPEENEENIRRGHERENRESGERPDNSVAKFLENAFIDFVGLGSVRAEVLRQASYIEVQKLRARKGLRIPTSPSRHLVFTGNPGTGKTTIARIIAGLYLRLGILKTDKVIDRSCRVGWRLHWTNGYKNTRDRRVCAWRGAFHR